jgi:hypothetical protein
MVQGAATTRLRPEPAAKPEPYFYLGPHWYRGSEPAFYDVANHPVTRLLEAHYPEIRRELETAFLERPEQFEANFTPYAYREEGWRTVNLYSYFLAYPRQRQRFPVTDAVVRRIPGMCMCQIAVLKPKTRIKAHFGDTDAIMRFHLGIRVPGRMPELGIRVGREQRCWEEGKVLAIQIARRHFAWNDTDEPRIALVVDVIRPEFESRRYEVAGKALAAIAMKWWVTRFPRTRRMPPALVRVLHGVLGRAFELRLRVQRTLGL